MTSPSSTPDSRLRITVEDLCDVLERLRSLHERLLCVLGAKEKALVEVTVPEIDALRNEEEKILREVIEEEKERLLITEELGDLLDHERPASIRVSEILPALDEPLAGRLETRREDLREVAVRLAQQNSVNRALVEHSIDHIQLFLARVAGGEGEPRYDRHGSASDDSGGPFLMDRRA